MNTPPPQDPMAPPTPTADTPILAELRRQSGLLESILVQLKGLRQTVDHFTDEGSSFRSAQPDAMTLAYLAIVGQVIGDRLDGSLIGVKDMSDYQDRFMKAAALLARSSLQVVDDFRQNQAPRQALEEAFKPVEG